MQSIRAAILHELCRCGFKLSSSNQAADMINHRVKRQRSSVHANGPFRANQRRRFSLAVSPVALGDGVSLAILHAAGSPSGFIGK